MSDIDHNDLMFRFGRTIGAISWAANIAIEELSPDQRVLFFERIMAGYCQHCGDKNPNRCHCTNDE